MKLSIFLYYYLLVTLLLIIIHDTLSICNNLPSSLYYITNITSCDYELCKMISINELNRGEYIQQCNNITNTEIISCNNVLTLPSKSHYWSNIGGNSINDCISSIFTGCNINLLNKNTNILTVPYELKVIDSYSFIFCTNF